MDLHVKYANGYRMQHKFAGAFGAEECTLCGYSAVSHGAQATCEMCGLPNYCDFFPDFRHAKKILLCESCLNKELKVAVEQSQKRQAELSAQNIKAPSDYFVAEDMPYIKQLIDEVNADITIPDNEKTAKICELVKERILNLQENILSLSNEVKTAQQKRDSYRVFLQDKQRELSEAKQKELGLLDFNYQQPTEKPRAPKAAPTTSRMTSKRLDEIKAYANQFGIPIDGIQMIMTA